MFASNCHDRRRGVKREPSATTSLAGIVVVWLTPNILSWVSAGQFSDVGQGHREGAEGKIQTDLKGKRLFALKVKADCMEPEFRHGDIIIVDPDTAWNNGDYVVARLNHDDEATFKQLKIYKNRIALHPLNYPVFEDLKYSKKDFDKKVTIIGKVVEKKKRY